MKARAQNSWGNFVTFILGWRSLHARLHSFIASESFLLSPQAENEKQTGRKVKIFKVERAGNSLGFFVWGFFLYIYNRSPCCIFADNKTPNFMTPLFKTRWEFPIFWRKMRALEKSVYSSVVYIQLGFLWAPWGRNISKAPAVAISCMQKDSINVWKQMECNFGGINGFLIFRTFWIPSGWSNEVTE